MNIEKLLNQYPRNVFLNITGYCNLKCIYCSSHRFNKPGQMTRESLSYFIREMREMGVLCVIITGGEPFLYNDIERVVREINQFAHVIINTNGILLSEKIKELTKYPMKKGCDINVSLDSLESDQNRKTRGNYDVLEILNTIEFLADIGYKVSIMCTVTNILTENDVNKFCQYSIDHPNIRVVFNQLKPCGLATDDLWTRLKPSKDIIEYIYSICEGDNNISTSLEIFKKRKCSHALRTHKKLLTCGAGKECIAISEDGTVYPCTFLNLEMGNLHQGKLKTICRESHVLNILQQLRTETLDKMSVCSQCSYKIECSGGCRANAYLFYKNLYAPDPYCATYDVDMLSK